MEYQKYQQDIRFLNVPFVTAKLTQGRLQTSLLCGQELLTPFL